MQEAVGLGRVYAPKAHGAWILHADCSFDAVGAFALFSSVAALFIVVRARPTTPPAMSASTRSPPPGASRDVPPSAFSGARGPRWAWRLVVLPASASKRWERHLALEALGWRRALPHLAPRLGWAGPACWAWCRWCGAECWAAGGRCHPSSPRLRPLKPRRRRLLQRRRACPALPLV